MRGHQRSDNILSDYCDSPKFKNHPLYGSKPNALQLILYFDEAELCNPLGTFRKKHKLGNYINNYVYIIYTYVYSYNS